MTKQPIKDDSSEATADVPFGSNEIRLSARQWLIVVLLVSPCLIFVPVFWKKNEPLQAAGDYRVPFALSDDYWHYDRWTDEITARDTIPVIGDSVVWGEYVTPAETLSESLNRQAGTVPFANAGLSGSHPLALEGLVRYYTRSVRDRRVILHCNLLWMSTPERDLQTDKEQTFNHPRLVPQISPRIPPYKASADDRLGNLVDHHVDFRAWVHHLRITYFDSLDVHNWSIEHPYSDPVAQLRLPVPTPKTKPRHESVAWFERGIPKQGIEEFPWVDLESSLQFQAFQRTVRLLQARGNRVFVIVGPFNEHLLEIESLNRYRELKQFVGDWLTEHEVPHVISHALPSEEYGDASHPLAAGYNRLAEQLFDNATFQDWQDSPAEIALSR